MTDFSADLYKAFEASRDGYSFERYGEKAWRANIRWLLALGLTADHAAAMMNSKLTRWAADQAGDKDLDGAVYRFCVRFEKEYEEFRAATRP